MRPGRIALVEAPAPGDLADTPEAFLRRLGGPALLRVPGRDRSRVRGLATLLHGNEPSGVRALHAWLATGRRPAVDLLCFVGAVEAALAPPGFAFRMLPGRPDLNRCFRPPWQGAEAETAGELLRCLREAGCECLVDLHNNTGRNPPYGVALRADAAAIQLVRLFAGRMVVTDLRLGTLTEATAGDFPSVTVECGRAGDPDADAIALAGIRRYADLGRLETRSVDGVRMTVLGDALRVRARPDASLAYGDRPEGGVDLTMRQDVDRHSFELLAAGMAVGWVAPGAPWPLEALGPDGRDVSREWFGVRDGRLEIRRAGVPIMMTTDAVAARSDCLFYLTQPREQIG